MKILNENEGYKQAFYEMAEILGIGARPDSPKNVFEQVMKPKLEALMKERGKLASENITLAGMVTSWPQERCPVTEAVTDVQPDDLFPETSAYLNSVRAEAIANALDASSNHCDTDCVMDAYDCSYEIAEMRSAGAIALHDGLVAYANELRAGKDGE